MVTRVAVAPAEDARPTQVTVGPFVYSIEWPAEMPGKFGETDHNRLRIQVCTGYALSQQQDTLVHEILHAIHQVAGCVAAWKTSDDLEELVTNTTSPLLWQVLRNHPDVIDWLRA